MSVFYKNNRIAALIRTGLEMDVTESPTFWIGQVNDTCYACAVGMALIGKMGVFRANVAFVERLWDNHGDELTTISELLEIEPLLVEEISRLHNDGLPAIEIAEALEYEDGDDQLDLHPLPD
jgi:hypothetical protein